MVAIPSSTAIDTGQPDAGDLTAGDIECQHADQPLLSVEIEGSRAAVDLDGAQRHARKAGGPADPVDQRARDAVAPAQRPRERRNLAAAVAGELHVVSEQRLDRRCIGRMSTGTVYPADQFFVSGFPHRRSALGQLA
jgi:hypothetical protein